MRRKYAAGRCPQRFMQIYLARGRHRLGNCFSLPSTYRKSARSGSNWEIHPANQPNPRPAMFNWYFFWFHRATATVIIRSVHQTPLAESLAQNWCKTVNETSSFDMIITKDQNRCETAQRKGKKLIIQLGWCDRARNIPWGHLTIIWNEKLLVLVDLFDHSTSETYLVSYQNVRHVDLPLPLSKIVRLHLNSNC